MTGVTLAQASTALAAAVTDLAAARKLQTYSIGNRQAGRAGIADLQAQVDIWSRQVRELTDEAAGVSNPGFMVPKWT